jgi:hypothetical protein
MPLRRSLTPLFLASVVTAMCIATAAPAVAILPTTASNIRNFEPEFMASSHTYTRTEAIAHAKEFDVIAAVPGAFAPYVADMKAANPDLVLLAYMNGGYSMGDNGSKYPDTWYARDKNGKKIKSLDFGNYLMKVWDSHWVGDVASRCGAAISMSHYGGCFLDSLGPAAIQAGYTTGLPVDPSTGKVWTKSAWMRATANLAGQVKTRIGTKLLVPNGVQNGMEYFDPAGSTGVLADPTDAAMVELFVRPPFTSLTTYRSASQWKDDLDMLVSAGANGRTLLCLTKAWSNGTMDKKDRVHKYALGTFLLGTNGRSYFSFLYDKNTGRPNSFWDIPIGAPSGKYSSGSSVYRRVYTNGLVLVNPGDSSRSVQLSRRYVTTGGSLITSVTLAAHTASILTLP